MCKILVALLPFEKIFGMEWNMENFSVEWKIFSMKWKKIACMEYQKIFFHAMSCM